MFAQLRPDNRTFQHPETRRCFGIESGRNRHLDDHVLPGGNALECHEQTARAYVDGRPKFERVAAVLIRAVNKNRKSQRDTLPTAGLVLDLGHV